MATLLDLFKSQKKDLYGKVGSAIIESRGLLNPPRGAALLASSPDAIADLIGNQIGGALGGSANRPSDTIFKNNTPFSKPISLFRTQDRLRRAIEPDTAYFIKKNPAPASLIASFNQGASNVAGMAANLAIRGITKGGLRELSNNLKKKNTDAVFGPKFGPKDSTGKPTVLIEDKFFSTHYRDKNGQLVKREPGTLGSNGFSWDRASSELILKTKITEDELQSAEKNGHVVVTFAKIIDDAGNVGDKVPFMGAVTGISEDVAPEWTNFRHIGSPFKVNRYLGVERSVRFNLKLYYLTNEQKSIMITKLNYLKSLAFPDSNVVTSKFGTSSQYAIAPNIVKFSIGSLYKDVAGYIESLSFEIDDMTTWPKAGSDGVYNDFDTDNKDNNFMYPSIVDVSIGIKIIENHRILSGSGNTKTYRYDFDGQLESKDKKIIEALKKIGLIPNS